MTRVKICGITRETDLRVAVEAGADAIGVVSEVPVDSPREVSRERAAELVAAAPPFVTTVLVTMPTSPERAVELVDAVGADAIQVHGGFRPDELTTVRTNVDAHILYVVDADDVTTATRYEDAADALVVDSVDADGGGGTGETHDWDHTRAATAGCETPIVLAGGLTPANVVDAVETVDPFAVDTASGVESRDGEKDPDAVRTFVERAKGTSRRPKAVEGRSP